MVTAVKAPINDLGCSPATGAWLRVDQGFPLRPRRARRGRRVVPKRNGYAGMRPAATTTYGGTWSNLRPDWRKIEASEAASRLKRTP